MRVTRDREAYHSLLLAVPAVLFLQEVEKSKGREDRSVDSPTASIIPQALFTNAIRPQPIVMSYPEGLSFYPLEARRYR